MTDVVVFGFPRSRALTVLPAQTAQHRATGKCSFNPTATGDNHEHADSLSIARS
jgi:hypothetical protein